MRRNFPKVQLPTKYVQNNLGGCWRKK